MLLLHGRLRRCHWRRPAHSVRPARSAARRWPARRAFLHQTETRAHHRARQFGYEDDFEPYLGAGAGSRPGCASSAGKDCAPELEDNGLGCAGAAGCDGFGAADADAGTGAAEADCWPRVLVATAAMKRRAESSFARHAAGEDIGRRTPGFL